MERARDKLGDGLAALGLAGVLSAGWAARDWAALFTLRLPDTDDLARLQQIRDWLGGQPFADMAQHRLANGLMMHWSRLPDLVPAAFIRCLTPLVGQHGAELAAVVAWPAMLFAAMLFLVARITRIVAPESARTALVVAAIAYPVTSLFAPGRIDHHGLQIVLLLLGVRALLGRPGAANGALFALASTASLVIGMEIAPFLAVMAGWMAARWLRGAPGAPLAGFGAALLGAMMAARAIFGGNGWSYPACDGFNDIVWQLAMLGGGGALALGVGTRWLTGLPARAAAAAVTLGAVLALGWPAARACLHPYGNVDPLLARLWLDHVAEAQSLLVVPPASAIGYAGLLLAGIGAALWRWRASHAPGWAVLLSLQLASLALALFELRGVYAGAIVGVPALAAGITVARAHGAAALASAWLAAAGMLYPLAAQALVAPVAPAASPGCGGLAALTRQPPALVIAGIDHGPALLIGTRHRVLAAPYHRNNAGNGAMYRFFLSPPEAAAGIARRWGAGLVLLCPGDFDEIAAEIGKDSLIARLRAGDPPVWLRPVAPGLYRVAGLPERPATL
ncbi:hypothetical protein [Sphingomonas sp.]|uniref:hypothetical protein n=1 Tax=Sphingomonas sp. TaxID=28214 RepID=UPI001DDCFED7|nr:hypothetical protein [Sphingomonas sp.]MBX9797339.1 hypothetical protein [Sphingomonas sp.]